MIAKIRQLLIQLGQEHLFEGVAQLDSSQLQLFLAQLEKFTPALSMQQKNSLKQSKPTVQATPLRHAEKSGSLQDHQSGEALLAQGKVGCLILAGGQGSRLRADVPKGTISVSPIQGKSLFQIFCERVKAASEWYKQPLPLCVMTSPLNHRQTIHFFQEHSNFGLLPSQLAFFEQQMLPLIDDQGLWFLEEPGRIAEGPDGNGHALRRFYESGLWEKFRAQGVEYLNIIVVDNALADPFDAELFDFAQRTGADVALKAVERLSPEEKMGVLAECSGKLKLIEYSELPSEASSFRLSNTGLFCISMAFIRQLHQVELPLHLARKTAKSLLPKSSIWKCERFIFDLFDYAQNPQVLVYPREKIYAPLKNATGDKSLETVKQALYAHYRETYYILTGRLPLVDEFELSPAFYYPSEELKRALSQHSLSNKSYIEFTKHKL